MNKLEFKDYGLTIKLTPFINIIGGPGSGKTMLLRMLINNVYNPNIYLDEVKVLDLDLTFKKQNIAACLDLKFNTSSVKEELVYYQEKCGIDIKTIFDNLDRFSAFFNLEELINQKVSALNIYDRALIRILSLLIIKPKILGIDNLFTYLDLEQKTRIIKFAKEQKITILNITSNSEELLLGIDIIVLDNHQVKAYDKTKAVLSNEKLLASVGFDLPFVVNLSNGLKYYQVVDKEYYDIKSLVGALWQ